MEEKVYTTFEISKLLSVDITTIMAWVDSNKLRAYRTPGGHRRILHRDFIQFLKTFNMPIPAGLDHQGQKVLLVDDDALTVRLITRLLNKSGIPLEIESATDGFEAGQKFETFLPDLVILDILLPGLDGYKVCKKIRSHKKNADAKILAISGVDVEQAKSKILRHGADAFLPKPLNNATLIETVQTLLKAEKIGV